jgi:hypothetical protein
MKHYNTRGGGGGGQNAISLKSNQAIRIVTTRF